MGISECPQAAGSHSRSPGRDISPGRPSASVRNRYFSQVRFLVRLTTLVVTSSHFSPTMPDRHQPLDPGSPQSPEHLESVRFFPSGSGLGLVFLSLLSMALVDRDKAGSRGREPVASASPKHGAARAAGSEQFVTAPHLPRSRAHTHFSPCHGHREGALSRGGRGGDTPWAWCCETATTNAWHRPRRRQSLLSLFYLVFFATHRATCFSIPWGW